MKRARLAKENETVLDTRTMAKKLSSLKIISQENYYKLLVCYA